MPPPSEISRALTLDTVAARYGKFPSEVLDADVLNLRVANIAMLFEGPPPQQSMKAKAPEKKTLKADR